MLIPKIFSMFLIFFLARDVLTVLSFIWNKAHKAAVVDLSSSHVFLEKPTCSNIALCLWAYLTAKA